jgi:hypothetical protein
LLGKRLPARARDHATHGEDKRDRVIGAFVMISGIAFLTVITAAVTATLFEAARRRLPPAPDRELPPELMREVTSRLSAIEARLDKMGPRAGE